MGSNRIAMGFLDAGGDLLSDLQVAASVWPDEDEQLPADATRTEMTPRTMDAEDHHADSAVSGVTLSTAEVAFPQPGTWSMRIEIRRGDETLEPINATFTVVEDPPHPQPGERIPATEQRVLRDVEELGQIDVAAFAFSIIRGERDR